MILTVHGEEEMKKLGAKLGALFNGGEVVELVGDVGAGKTTLAKGIANGLGVSDDVQSPSFTINRVYATASHLQLAHYDFYRLHDPGIMISELNETLHDPQTVILIEWAEIVSGVLPADHVTIKIVSPTETSREVTFVTGGPKSDQIVKDLV